MSNVFYDVHGISLFNSLFFAKMDLQWFLAECRHVDVKPEILLPYIHRVLDPEKGAILLTSVLSSSKERQELVERSEYVFNSVLF